MNRTGPAPATPPAAAAPASMLAELTSIRAFAAAVVVLFHMFFDEHADWPFWLGVIVDGHLGVDLFFVLSGFILAHVYLPAWRAGRFDYGNFIANRFARVYPLHLAMLLVFVASYQFVRLAGLGGAAEGEVWGDFPFHLLLLHAWGFTGGHSWNFPSWSVSAEAFAYLAFPVSLLVFRRSRPVPALVAALALLLALSAALSAYGVTLTKMMYDFGIVRIIPEFLIGVALYRLFEVRRMPPRAVRPVIALICLGLFLGSGFQINETLIVVMLAALIFAVAHLSLTPKGGIMRSRALVYLGEVSYATYMVHIFAITAVERAGPRLGLGDGPSWLRAAITIALVYAGSVVLHHVVEKPGRVALRALFARWRAAARRRSAAGRPDRQRH